MVEPLTQAAAPELSIVIEWENVLLAEAHWALEMLGELDRQVAAAGVAVEVLVLFDEQVVDRAGVEAAVAASGISPGLALEFAAVDGLHYYDLKNAGAAKARGDVLLFLDSDVVPEPRWLAAVLAAPDDPSVEVVGSSPYIESDTLYGKTFALSWFFPLHTDAGPPEPSRQFYANSVAIRRHTFLANRFDTSDGRARGACTTLSRTLSDQGITVWRLPEAKVRDLAPNGVAHYLIRALMEGHDWAVVIAGEGWSWPHRWARGLGLATRATLRGTYRIVRHRRHVGLRWWQVPAALVIHATYASTRLVGLVVATVRPQVISRRVFI
jgi:hypothetical protein